MISLWIGSPFFHHGLRPRWASCSPSRPQAVNYVKYLCLLQQHMLTICSKHSHLGFYSDSSQTGEYQCLHKREEELRWPESRFCALNAVNIHRDASHHLMFHNFCEKKSRKCDNKISRFWNNITLSMQVTLTLFLAWLFWIGFLFCSPHQVPEETEISGKPLHIHLILRDAWH